MAAICPLCRFVPQRWPARPVWYRRNRPWKEAPCERSDRKERRIQEARNAFHLAASHDQDSLRRRPSAYLLSLWTPSPSRLPGRRIADTLLLDLGFSVTHWMDA